MFDINVNVAHCLTEHYLIGISPQKKHSVANNLSKDFFTLSRSLMASCDCEISLLWYEALSWF